MILLIIVKIIKVMQILLIFSQKEVYNSLKAKEIPLYSVIFCKNKFCKQILQIYYKVYKILRLKTNKSKKLKKKRVNYLPKN